MQLKAQWVNQKSVAILQGNKVISIPEVRFLKDRSMYLKNNGNAKTHGVVGIINNISNGCFRAYTKFGKCNTSCYDGKCYGDHSIFALKNKYNNYSIIRNGVDNNFFHINLPNQDNPNYKLNNLKLWRIGSESSDMSLALALDLVEPWVAYNPDKFFTGISSDYFFVPAKNLTKLAKYDNLVIGHTVSDWFADDDLENRIGQIERFQKYGIQTVVWVTTNTKWLSTQKDKTRHKKMVDKILDIVTPEQIIEVPFHSKGNHCNPILNINPRGFCCDMPNHKCKGCKVLCGLSFLKSTKRKQL